MDAGVDTLTQEEIVIHLDELRERATVGNRPLPSFMAEEIEPFIADGEFTTTDLAQQANISWHTAKRRIKKWVQERKIIEVGKRRIFDGGGVIRIAMAYGPVP